jgi:hypothetical protein
MEFGIKWQPTIPHNLCIFLKINAWENLRANEKNNWIAFERRTEHFAFQKRPYTAILISG